MNARMMRPRSRRGRHPPPVELDPVVESSEEVEVAAGNPEAGPAPPQESYDKSGLPWPSMEAAGQDTGNRADKELDEDNSMRQSPPLKGSQRPSEEVHQAPEEAPENGETVPPRPEPPDVFQMLQHTLSSLEAAVAAWRQPPPSCSEPGEAESRGEGAAGALDGQEGTGSCQREAARLTERNAWLQLALGSREDELARMQASLQAVRAEKEMLQREVQELQDSLLRLQPCPPPSHSQTGSSGSGSSSPGAEGETWGTQNPFPLAHPLLRHLRSDSSTQILGPLPIQPLVPEMHLMEAQTVQLQRNIEKLKCFNRLLSAVLQGYKGQCEGLTMQLSRREAEATALHLALQYSEHCEEAYGALLALRKAALGTEDGTSMGDLWAAEKEAWRVLAQEEAAIQGGKPRENLPSPEGSSVDKPTLQEVASQLQGLIQCLQDHRALVKIPPEPGPTLAPIPNVPRTEAMLQAMLETQPGPALLRLEKTQIQEELVATRETLADLALRLQLARREKRGLELREAALRALGPAHALLLEQLQWERSQLDGEEGSDADSSRGGSSGDEEEWPQGPPAGPDGTCGVDGGQVDKVRDPEELARELELSLTRSLDLRGQLQSVREELEQVAQRARIRRTQSAKLNSDLCKAHSSLVLAFRGSHRKQEEQQRKLEQQVALMEARQAEELALLEATARALERRQLPPQPGETLL
ncbi:PREDICTED: Usher syndrome type-1C protein-binding protein 1 [Elephantulus edwardii]|uniref:Usher syndrome type-1C protein-binding protein 1 n=1 Tax=Elephantulus edwardii TaxID=28737 RepID=UPI0003F07C10|nr:PREDICTED: Usher syndrome type-1C protein-binding protein 1 [Elephantulus edwardii]